jgi:hypothetical protein
MLLRSSLLACATLIASAALPAMAETPDDARCAPASFRIYFAQGATALDAAALEILAAAERMNVGCDHAEFNVALDASSPLADERAQAIAAVAEGWDVVRVSARSALQRASYSAGPDYADVTLGADAAEAGAPLREMEAGV